MEHDKNLVKRRLVELSRRAAGGMCTFSGFLSMDEQAILATLARELATPATLFGGAPGCERQVAGFCDGWDEKNDVAKFPISCLEVTPTGGRFGVELVHREVLGSILGLGVERSVLGDIVIRPDAAYAFCLSSISVWICENLSRVGRNNVRCKVVEQPPDGPLFSLSEQLVQVASERIDAVIAKAYTLSREDSAALFVKEKVFVNAALCKNNSSQLKQGETVSVRGFGRFIYQGIYRVSKKEKLNVKIAKYS